MNTSRLFWPVIGNSVLFFLALVCGIQKFSYAKYALALVPAALALRMYLALRQRAAPDPAEGLRSAVQLLALGASKQKPRIAGLGIRSRRETASRRDLGARR